MQVDRLTEEQAGKAGLMYEVSHNIDSIAEEAGAVAQVEQHIPMMRRSKDIPIAVRLDSFLAKQAKRAAQVPPDMVANEEVVGKGSQGNEAGHHASKRDRSPSDGAQEDAVPMNCAETVEGSEKLGL